MTAETLPRWLPGFLAVVAGLVLAATPSAGPWVTAELSRMNAPGVTSKIEGEIELGWGLKGLPEVTEIAGPSAANADAASLASVYQSAVERQPAPELDSGPGFILDSLLTMLGMAAAGIGAFRLFGAGSRALYRGVAAAGAAGVVTSVVLGDMAVSSLYWYLVALPTGVWPATTYHTDIACVVAITAGVVLCVTGWLGARPPRSRPGQDVRVQPGDVGVA
ncbi:hypothetical protein [Amycolatopsis albispora]|uniref:Uncharacterized protein n=1 Tax=Amycolatopsis albispora TaxID=1804986 RepID=A0A344L8I6_9PSEU|nr:hypothetical protein [Amycolatopsis albispora]AXB44360.1 hypothetical protein A4R43_19065 [Amycolatopsis albispora]